MGCIELRGVGVRIDSHPVLEGIDLELGESRVVILGPNGSGKSTLVRLFNGLVLPNRGQVLVNGLSPTRQGRQVRGEVGFVFQNPQNQIVMPRVADDIAFGLKNQGVKGPAAEQRIREQLENFGISDLYDREVFGLSGGQKQLVALVGVLVMRPKIVIFDEPTTSLDLVNKLRFQRLVSGLDLQVITISHDLDLVEDYDRAVLLDHGRIVADGKPSEICEQYRQLCRDML